MRNKRNVVIPLVQCVICVGILVGVMLGTSACGGKENGETTKETTGTEKNKPSEFISQRYSNANDRMVYFPLEDSDTLERWSVDGKEKQPVTLPAEQYGSEDTFELLWVGNEEIIWGVEKDEEEIQIQRILSTPIQQNGQDEKIVPEQTKELFTIDISGMGWEQMYGACGGTCGQTGTVYVDETRIVFLSYGTPYVYDRKTGGEPVAVQEEEHVCVPDSVYSLTAEVAGDSLFCHTGRTEGKVEESSYEFWNYHLGDGTAQSIDTRCFNDAAYVADSIRGMVYYQVIDGWGIWQYDSRTGAKSELISREMFRTCYEENQISWEEDAYYNDSLFVEGDCLYFIKNRENPLVFSYSLFEGSLSYEKELTEAVQCSGYCAKKARSRQLYIVKDKLLLYWSDEVDDEDYDYYICIDIPTAQMKAVGKKDSEKIYFGMIGAWEEMGTTGAWEKVEPEPKNSQEKTSDLLSVKEQLALISRCRDVWVNDDGMDENVMRYAVTDLDHNGRLEVIASTGMQGSGGFTRSEYYQVSEDGTELRHIIDAAEEVDIVDGIDTAYVDKDTNMYYYCAQDYVSGGAGARYVWYGAIVLKSGMLTTRTYAGAESTFDEKKNEQWHYVYYVDGVEKKISAGKFHADERSENLFAGYEKKKVKISWFFIGGKKEQTSEKVEEKLRKSYERFSVK